MEQQNYQCSISAAVTPREAFEGISNVPGWWAKDTEGETDRLNGVFTVRFGTTHVTFKITEMEPYKKIVWQVTDSYLPWLNDKTEWTGTAVSYEIAPAADGATSISMTHIGLVPAVECYNQCESGWNRFIQGSLPKLLADKVGLPQ